MKVFKFGGASVKDAIGFRNVVSILKEFSGDPVVLVLSAMGKTTNKLEKIVEAHHAQNEKAFQLLEELRKEHYSVVSELMVNPENTIKSLNDHFVEIEWVLEEEPHENFDFSYDQIVSVGELLSTTILSDYARQSSLENEWLDARGLIATNDRFRQATVDWKTSESKILSKLKDQTKGIFITQGFIGCTSENFTTTLGREGSDYTAAIFAYILGSDSLHIWKDVPGILTGDPKKIEDVEIIDKMSYKEAIEMTYYGAKVIHPKTIKPLQNKNIPLYVRSFVETEDSGTLIHEFKDLNYPPVVVLEDNQCLIKVSTKDYSFIAENHLSRIFTILSDLGLRINLMRNTAISFTICVKNELDRISRFRECLHSEFNFESIPDLDLVTIRHYDTPTVDRYKNNRELLFEEHLGKMIQMVLR